jgi:hypothetical protein
MRNGIQTVLLSFVLLTPALAEQSGVSFAHKDWEIVCDNTLTCRVAGYAHEDGQGSVLLTRKAGARTAVTGEVTLADIEVEDAMLWKSGLTLWINGKSTGKVKLAEDGYWQLSETQTRDLINAVKGSGNVEFRGGAEPFVLSGDGAYAVLLKMDEIQGRIDTPGALTKKGNKPESSVRSAVSAPVIRHVIPATASVRTLDESERALLEPQLLATMVENDSCEALEPLEDRLESAINLQPLNPSLVLISTLCWRAAYNEGYGFWVIDSQLKGKPTLITVSGSEYSNGEIFGSHKGRGIGDCWGTFRKSREATTGQCRFIRAGGTWDLPGWVAEVKTAE